MEMQEGWMKEYSWATYVDWNLPGSEEYKQYTRRCAEYLKWNYDEVPGDPGLMQRMLDGKMGPGGISHRPARQRYRTGPDQPRYRLL